MRDLSQRWFIVMLSRAIFFLTSIGMLSFLILG
uniref:Uncharacterized protein n=1 Tax=Arundo donax TaxID=35708 RepID=A0A0A9EBJ1_ARUDO